MRQDHIFHVASLTKTFTAVMMMQYVQEKKISLDDYVLDYPFLSIGFTSDRLIDPNVKLKHVLSHTSEGKPGDNFVYHGGRYNFVYGVFEKIGGITNHYQACAQEFRKRIEEPLGLTSTLPGYPTDKKDPRIPRITTPYFLDSGHKAATSDRGASGSTTLYPATGLLSTVDDLSKYMIALDESVLLSSESYAHLTTPYTLNDGRLSPYGLGWSTQKVGGNAVHWHYGYGDSYSALLVRLPEKKTSFIFLSNTGAASAPFLLGYGNLLTSPFAVAFLESVLPGVLSGADRDYSRMFLVHYAETAFGRNRGEAKSILRRLRSTAPARFHQADRAMICLLADLSDPAFSGEMDSLVEAYRGSGDFHPDISLAIADYYGKAGEQGQRNVFLRQIADRIGYGEERANARCLRQTWHRTPSQVGSQKKVEGTYGWPHDMRKTLDPGSQQRIVWPADHRTGWEHPEAAARRQSAPHQQTGLLRERVRTLRLRRPPPRAQARYACSDLQLITNADLALVDPTAIYHGARIVPEINKSDVFR